MVLSLQIDSLSLHEMGESLLVVVVVLLLILLLLLLLPSKSILSINFLCEAVGASTDIAEDHPTSAGGMRSREINLFWFSVIITH